MRTGILSRFCFLLFIALTEAASAQTYVSGYILSNATWTPAGSPYIVNGNTLIGKVYIWKHYEVLRHLV